MYNPIGIKSSTLEGVVSEINSELRNIQLAVNATAPFIVETYYEHPKIYITNHIVRIPEGHAWGAGITPGLWIATGQNQWAQIGLSTPVTPGA